MLQKQFAYLVILQKTDTVWLLNLIPFSSIQTERFKWFTFLILLTSSNPFFPFVMEIFLLQDQELLICKTRKRLITNNEHPCLVLYTTYLGGFEYSCIFISGHSVSVCCHCTDSQYCRRAATFFSMSTNCSIQVFAALTEQTTVF